MSIKNQSGRRTRIGKFLDESGFFFFVAFGHTMAWIFCPSVSVICYWTNRNELALNQSLYVSVFWLMSAFLIVLLPALSLLRLLLNPSLRSEFSSHAKQRYWRKMAAHWNVLCLPRSLVLLLFRNKAGARTVCMRTI